LYLNKERQMNYGYVTKQLINDYDLEDCKNEKQMGLF